MKSLCKCWCHNVSCAVNHGDQPCPGYPPAMNCKSCCRPSVAAQEEKKTRCACVTCKVCQVPPTEGLLCDYCKLELPKSPDTKSCEHQAFDVLPAVNGISDIVCKKCHELNPFRQPKESTKSDVKHLARNIVNQLFDEAQVHVVLRQSLNDRCDEFVEKLLTQLLLAERERCGLLVDEYLENCEKCRQDGAMSQFGSASGGMMLSSCEDALKALKAKILTPEQP